MCDKSDHKRTPGLNRREFLAVFAGGAASVALEACSSPAPTPGTQAGGHAGVAPPPPPTTQAPTKGGDLILGFLRDQPNLDPPVADSDPQGRLVNSMVDPLIRQQDPGKFAPGLAESWEVSQDGKLCTFKAHKGLKFGDGTPFRAQAVKFSFDQAIELKLKAQMARLVALCYVSGLLDGYTIWVTFTQPCPLVLTWPS